MAICVVMGWVCAGEKGKNFVARHLIRTSTNHHHHTEDLFSFALSFLISCWQRPSLLTLTGPRNYNIHCVSNISLLFHH
jgi:hypothetical protein